MRLLWCLKAFIFAPQVEAAASKTLYIKGLERGGHVTLAVQAMKIARMAKNHDIDRIIVNNGRLVHWLKALQKLPVLCIYHGGKIDRILKADKILTINDQQCEWIKERGFPAADVTVVDNVMPVDELPAWQERSFDGLLTIGTLRLLEPAKGVDTLVEAFGILAKNGEKFKGMIGSDGTQRQVLEQRAKELGLMETVSFTGWTEDSSDFYQDLDIYVLPSRFEEWGLGIVEAQSHSLPVIATDCLGPKRLIKDGSNGLLVPRDNPQAMADALVRLLHSAPLCQQLAKNRL